jgi:hypothetical protein
VSAAASGATTEIANRGALSVPGVLIKPSPRGLSALGAILAC